MNFRSLKHIFSTLSSLLLVLCVAFTLSGCATPEDVGRVQWDINELKSEIKDMKTKSPTPVERQNLDKKLLEIQNTQESTAKSVSDLLIQFQSLTNEFRVLTGRFEEARFQTDKSSAELKEEKERTSEKIKELGLAIDELKKKISQMETPQPSAKEELKPAEGTEARAGEGAKKPEGKEAEKAESKKEPPKPEVKDVYMDAYQAYKNGRTVEAREKFATLLKDYPTSEYADNSRFWIAESYYKDGNYEDAILSYEEMLKKNPKSDKVPGALLKQGLAFFELKDEKTGKIILEKLIQAYPDSEQAKVAKKKLGKTTTSKKK
jgi:tol-pal system protein YbgF